jgi:cysteinyl-tRNA synthetase
LQLFNTMGRRVEPFTPGSPPHVSMYTCGPTVYNFAHIGNFRTFLFEDLLRRWLEASAYEVFHVMNLTDVDDKTIQGAGAAGIPLAHYTVPYIKAFHDDCAWLRIRPAHAYPRATEFIPAMVRLVEGLLARGVAYRGDDGSVYFSIEKFPSYGRLAQLERRALRAGASERVSADEYAKEDARDFVLWKAARPEDEAVGAAWDTPFGRGRPGWHLECSAMALDRIKAQLGADVLDIHAGGVDLIFPHHEDEIAQSCAYTGKPEFARYWVHGEFLNIRGAKMSKRFGNITTPRDLREDGVDPGAIRLLVYQTHYRQRLDLTDEGLDAAREGARRLGEFGDRLQRAAAGASDESEADIAARFRQRGTDALNDDLNAPQAVAALFDFVREANRLLDETKQAGPAIREAWGWGEAVLDVAAAVERVRVTGADGAPGELLQAPQAGGDDGAWARAWAARRVAAKKARNFKEADEIRDRLRAHGFEIRDTREGSEVVRSRGTGNGERGTGGTRG